MTLWMSFLISHLLHDSILQGVAVGHTFEKENVLANVLAR